MFQEIPASKQSLVQRKPVRGVGINDTDYQIKPTINGKKYRCPYYQRLVNMIQRCYSAKYQDRQPTYVGCTVCDEWLTFSVFKSWMITQDWKNKELDKDILNQGNKIYSPDSCIFVNREINALLVDQKSTRGLCPKGVSFHKQRKKFVVRMAINGKSTHIGLYLTPELASAAYLKTKYALIKEVALQQAEPLRSALLRYKVED